MAIKKGCRRLQWQVLDWNTPAIDFYVAMGGEFMNECRTVRMDDEALERLARGDAGERADENANGALAGDAESGS